LENFERSQQDMRLEVIKIITFILHIFALYVAYPIGNKILASAKIALLPVFKIELFWYSFLMLLFCSGILFYILFGLLEILSWRRRRLDLNEARLRSTGIFSIVRHPIKTGVLSTLLASSLYNLTTEGNLNINSIGIFVVFLLLMITLARFEESLLSYQSLDYRNYSQKVPMLMPLKWIILRLIYSKNSNGIKYDRINTSIMLKESDLVVFVFTSFIIFGFIF